MKETIYYKKKKIALPFKDADYSNPFEMETITNPLNKIDYKRNRKCVEFLVDILLFF